MKNYPARQFDIPFYVDGQWLVKLQIRASAFSSDRNTTNPSKYTPADEEMIKEKALNRFVTFLYPEFYVYLYNKSAFSAIDNASVEVAEDVVGTVQRLIGIKSAFLVPFRPAYRGVVCALYHDVDKGRQTLREERKFPDFEATLAFFNEQQDIESDSTQSQFAVGSLGKTTNTLNDGLQAFNNQMMGFEGTLPGPLGVDFNGLQMGVQSAVNLVVNMLTTQLNPTNPSFDFTDADTLTVYFGKRTHRGKTKISISRVDYLLIEDGIGARPMRVGYFSNIKYNQKLSDPLILATLKNYQEIVDGINSPEAAQDFSFLQYLQNPDVQGALNQELGIDPATGLPGPIAGIVNELAQMDPKKEAENAFLNAAKQFGLIDLKDTEHLEKGFKTAFTAKEIDKLKRDVANNPEIFMKVLKANQSKALKKATDITRKLDNILQKGPLGFIDNNPIVERLFRQIGIQDLAKEAMLCVTFGMNFEASRITKAVQKSLSDINASLYYPPALPKPGGQLTKPEIKLEDFTPFKTAGDLHKAVLSVIVNTLQQTALQIIKKLAEMLKFACPLNNPRSEDAGAVNLSNLLDDSQPDRLGGPGSPLNQLAAAFNMTPEQMQEYLREVSAILTSMDVCTLLQDEARVNVSDELIARIIEFNREYPEVEYVNVGMTARSTVLTFFTQLSKFVDVTDLCNQIANEVYVINRDSIDVCLTPYDPLSQDALSLVDILDGIQIDIPEINFECPDKANYLADPTITVSIPEVFSTLTRVVDDQFTESLTATRQALLEPRIVSGESGTDVFANARYAGVGTDELSEMNPEFLNKLIEILDKVASFNLEDCQQDLALVLGFDAAAAAGAASIAVEAVQSTLADPNFLSAIENVRNQLEDLSPEDLANLAEGATTAFSSYRFNPNFLREFIDYIDMSELTFASNKVSVPLNFNSRTGPAEGTQVEAVGTSTYRDVNLEFNFPFLSPFTFSKDQRLPQSIESAQNITGLGNVQVNPLTGEIIAPGVATCTDSEKITNRLLWDVLAITFQQSPGYNYASYYATAQSTVYEESYAVDAQAQAAEDVANLLTPAQAAQLNDIPTFLSFAPAAYNQIRFAGQASRQVPLEELTPPLLTAVQDYFTTHGDALLSSGILNFVVSAYEEKGNCQITFTPDVPQHLVDTVLSFNEDDLTVERSYMRVTYPRETEENPNLVIEFASDGDFLPVQKLDAFITESLVEQEFEEATEDLQNVYVKQFVDAFPFESPSDPNATVPLTPEEKRTIEAKHYPAAYATMVDRMFDWVVRNGIFDAATLQSLNLLPSSPDCPPSQYGDLLDLRGIFEQMRAEYVEGACSDDKPKPPLRTRVRGVIKYGLYLLLVQATVAQLIVKNIFVLSAFQISTVLGDRDGFVFTFLRSQIVRELDAFIENLDETADEFTLRDDLVNYFNIKANRQIVVNNGGIRYGDGEVAFLPGTRFTIEGSDNSKSFLDIIDFLLEDRLIIAADAINNVMRNALPGSTPLSLQEAFLASLPTYQVEYDTPAYVTTVAHPVFEQGDENYQVFLTRKKVATVGRTPRSRIKAWYYHDDDSQPLGVRCVNIFTLARTIPSGDEPMGHMDRVLAGDIVVTPKDRLDCLDQNQIDQILAFGGTVPPGRGCMGTTHAPVVDPERAATAATTGRLECRDQQQINLIYDFGGTIDPNVTECCAGTVVPTTPATIANGTAGNPLGPPLSQKQQQQQTTNENEDDEGDSGNQVGLPSFGIGN